jgi:hypothetical protein
VSPPPQVTPADFDKQPEKVKREAMEIKVDEEAPVVAAVPSRFRRICVFCGSSHGKKKSYQDAAIELGKELVIVLCLASFFSSFMTFSACSFCLFGQIDGYTLVSSSSYHTFNLNSSILSSFDHQSINHTQVMFSHENYFQ